MSADQLDAMTEKLSRQSICPQCVYDNPEL